MKTFYSTLAFGLLALQWPLLPAQTPAAPSSDPASISRSGYGPRLPGGAPAGMLIRRRADSAGYYLQIFTGSDDMQALDVRTKGQSLVIRSARSAHVDRRDSRGTRSFERRSSGFSKRLSLPRDADTANMKTSVENGVMTITLPRRKSGWGGFYRQPPGRFGPPGGYR